MMTTAMAALTAPKYTGYSNRSGRSDPTAAAPSPPAAAASRKLDAVSERGSRQVFGSISSAPARSATTTHTVASTGLDDASQPTTPTAATASRAKFPRSSPPTPRDIDKTKTTVTLADWMPSISRLQPAPSAAWDANAVTPSTLQMHQVPRCGRVLPRRMPRM